MLYDNALLARVYLEAWQVTGKDLYRRVATEVLDYVLRDMTDPRGGFHSAEDADSEGQEGKFYVWRPGQIAEILGDEDAVLFNQYYGVTEAGNFEGDSILHVPQAPEVFARDQGLSLTELEQRLGTMRLRLLEARGQRVRPGKDDKVIAAWNGMMISALARGYQVLGAERFLTAANRAADFVLTEMIRDGVLLRTYRGDGSEAGTAKLPAYLDDYAEVANGLIDLYETTFDVRRLEAAERLVRRMVADFADEAAAGFFFTSDLHTNLLARTKPFYDGAVPSGNATAALVLLRLSDLLGDAAYGKRAERLLASARGVVVAQPRGYLNLLCAADFALHPVKEIAIAGGADAAETRRFLELIHGRFIPNKVLALLEPEAPGAAAIEERIPLLRYKSMMSGKTTVYVCLRGDCKLPVTDAQSLARVLDAPDSAPTSAEPAERTEDL
jgi:uncharacterized protein YyaL (SSP411 family)